MRVYFNNPRWVLFCLKNDAIYIRLRQLHQSASFVGARLFGKGARSRSATNATFIICNLISGRGHLGKCPAKSKNRSIKNCLYLSLAHKWWEVIQCWGVGTKWCEAGTPLIRSWDGVGTKLRHMGKGLFYGKLWQLHTHLGLLKL